MQSSEVSSREQCRDVTSPFWVKWVNRNIRFLTEPVQATTSSFINGSLPLEPVGQGKVDREIQELLLNHVVVEFGPLKDVLLAHNVWVDEQVAVAHTEVFLAGGTLEALQVVNLVPHAHRHLKRSDPLLTGGTETVLTEEPEWKRGQCHWEGDEKHHPSP